MDLQPSPTTRRPQPQAANRPPQRAEQRTWVLHLGAEIPLERGELEHGLGGVLALVALAAAGAGEGLVHVLHGEDAERARDARAQLYVLDPAGCLVADVVVVRRLAADDRPEAGDAVVAAGLRDVGRGERE